MKIRPKEWGERPTGEEWRWNDQYGFSYRDDGSFFFGYDSCDLVKKIEAKFGARNAQHTQKPKRKGRKTLMSNPKLSVKDYFIGKTTTNGVTRLGIYRRAVIKRGRLMDKLEDQQEKKSKPSGWLKAPRAMVRISRYFKLREDVRAELKRLKSKCR